MKSNAVKDFAEYMQSIKTQADAKEAQESECDGCCGCDDDTDEELSSMVSALELEGDAESLLRAVLLMLMIVAKEAGFTETSKAAHALWVDA